MNLSLSAYQYEQLQERRPCPKCDGSGRRHLLYRPPNFCPTCHGSGSVPVLDELVVALDERPTAEQMCALCDGNGCEYDCGHRYGRCEEAYAGPNSHRICGRCKGIPTCTVPVEVVERATLTAEQIRVWARSIGGWLPWWVPDPSDELYSLILDLARDIERSSVYEVRQHPVGVATGGRVLPFFQGDPRDVTTFPCVVRTEWVTYLFENDEEVLTFGTDVSRWLAQVPDLRPGQWVVVFDPADVTLEEQ